MIGVIIVAHGKLAEGFLSPVEMIYGPADYLTYINFVSEDKEPLKSRIEKKVSDFLKNCDSVVILCDISMGSTYQEAVRVSLEYKNVEVFAGVNLPMLLFILSERDDSSLKDIISECIETSQKQIIHFTHTQKENKSSSSEGI